MELTGDPIVIGLQIAVTGVAVVFLALVLVMLTLTLLNTLERVVLRRSTPTPTPAAEPAPAPAESDELSPDLIAILTAAAAEMLAQPVRVTRIRYFNRPPLGTWSQQGRLTIMASRPVRRR